MKTSDFDYELPEAAIAARPAEPRDAARLLVHEIGADRTRHLHVRDLPGLLAAGDLLVVNDTRVRPARLLGRRGSGGALEILLVEPLGGSRWRALVKPAKRLSEGEEFELESGALRGVAVQRPLGADGLPGPHWIVALRGGTRGDAAVEELLERHGRMPLPPYMRKARGDSPEDPGDRERYQTVFARETGAVAAPTAGLHFTPDLLARLEQAGVERAAVTLHVGLGTFQPVEVEDPDDHAMHAEEYVLSAEVAAERARDARTRRARRRGRDHVRARARVVRRARSLVRAVGGVHATLRATGRRVPRGRRAVHELPPAAQHAVDARERVRRARADAAPLPRGARRGLPVLQLRRRDAAPALKRPSAPGRGPSCARRARRARRSGGAHRAHPSSDSSAVRIARAAAAGSGAARIAEPTAARPMRASSAAFSTPMPPIPKSGLPVPCAAIQQASGPRPCS